MKQILCIFTWCIMFLVLLWTLGACTTVPLPSIVPDTPGIYKSYDVGGWRALDNDGYTWALEDSEGRMIARCYYTYMRVGGIEKWTGVFYSMKTDFFGSRYYANEVDNLSGCFDWVNHMTLGGHYI